MEIKETKSKKGLMIFAFVSLSMLVVIFGGYIAYDKFIAESEIEEKENKNNNLDSENNNDNYIEDDNKENNNNTNSNASMIGIYNFSKIFNHGGELSMKLVLNADGTAKLDSLGIENTKGIFTISNNILTYTRTEIFDSIYNADGSATGKRDFVPFAENTPTEDGYGQQVTKNENFTIIDSNTLKLTSKNYPYFKDAGNVVLKK